jgi:hypothetical protein
MSIFSGGNGLAQDVPVAGAHRVLVIVPAYNEGRSVGDVVRRVRSAVPEAVVLVVDDGSIDATAAAASDAGATVIRLPYNLGIGGAVQTGFRYAARHGFDTAIQVDADGQHPPEEVPRLLKAMDGDRADLVVGSRFIEESGYRAPFPRNFGIWLFSKLLSALCGQRLTDTTSGFRAAGRAAILNLAQTYACDYPEVESLITLKKAGFSIREAPVRMSPRTEGRSSINLVKGVYYIVKVVLAVLVDALADPRWTKEEVVAANRTSPAPPISEEN